VPASRAILGGLEVLRFEGLAALGVTAIATTRRGGVSTAPYDTLNLGDHVGDLVPSVAENRRRVARAMAVADEDLAIAAQVHGVGISIVRRGDAVGEADVLVTDDPGIALCVLVADCVPIAVVDATTGVLGLGHAGWRGTAKGAAAATVGAIEALGGEPSRCRAVIGPCISGLAYQVGDDVAGALRDSGGAEFIAPDGTGRYLADLAAMNVAQLELAGIPADKIEGPPAWTDGGSTFFSDRAQRPCGRFALVARLANVDS
jgi:YfiH family protein